MEARRVAHEQAEEDYLVHLHRGSDALAAGDLAGAKEELERARALRPGHPKVLGLLGLCTFKLGELDEAASIYTALAHDNPLDVTVHVNLGLVELKRGNPRAAIRALEVATSLAPDHKKAFNYLGLAYAELQDHEQAAEAFRAAGAEAMVEKMERARAEAQGEALADVAPAPAPAGSGRAGAVSTLEAFTDKRRLHWPAGSPFGVDEEAVAIDFAGAIFTRLDGLLMARGSASWEAVHKRFRGEVTERPFGKGEGRMLRASGAAQLLFRKAPDRIYTVLRIEEDAYLVESCLFAFEDALDYENGRVAGTGGDLHLVRLRGKGQLLLVSASEIRSEAVRGNESVRLPAERLVGWWGALIPRWIETPVGRWIELAGEGEVLLAT